MIHFDLFNRSPLKIVLDAYFRTIKSQKILLNGQGLNARGLLQDLSRNIYYQTMFGHISIEITKHLQN
jgi:hypothetical protein